MPDSFMLRLIVLSLPGPVEGPGPGHSLRVDDWVHDSATLDVGIVRTLGLLPTLISNVAVHTDGHSKRPISASSPP